MKKKITSIAIASIIAATSGQSMASQDDGVTTNSKKQVAAISIGAVSGAILAGPAGLVVGGIVGALAGRSHTAPESNIQGIDHLAETETMLNEMLKSSKQYEATGDVMTASISNTIPVIGSDATEVIRDIVSNDLSMDVYFKAGSTDVEKFYSQQLAVISNLLNEIPELQLNLDGYSDRQGGEAENLQLSAERLASVRNYFVSQGIDDSRINVHAHGEKNFVSKPGDLDAYVFDRRVVVSFKTLAQDALNNVAIITQPSSL